MELKKIGVIVLGFLCLTLNVLATNKIHLVSVGISDYPGVANDLTLPTKDAASVKSEIQESFRASAGQTCQE